MAHGGRAVVESVDWAAYMTYMRARGFVRGTIRARLAMARDWTATHDLESATHRDVERWIAGRGLSAGSVRYRLVNLRAFYRWALREGVVDRDPTQLADRPAVPRRLPRPAPDRDIATVLRTSDARLRVAVALMACAGLRCVECSRLDWRDVDLRSGTVIVNGKGSRERLIDLSPDVIAALAAHALGQVGRPVGAVFLGDTGRRMSPARVSQWVTRAFRAMGSTVTAHQLRHRCATTALQHTGGDLLAVRDLLGHSSVSTTQIYTAVLPGRTAAASRSMHLPTAAA